MKNKYYLSLIILLIITFVIILFPPRVYQKKSNGSLKYATDIKKDDIYEAFFTTDLKDINKIGVRFSTYQYKNKHGIIVMQLYDNDTLVKSKRIKLKNVEDNKNIYMNFKNQKNSQKKHYKLVIKYEEYYDDIKLATWYSYSATENNYVLYNNDRQLNSLYYELYGKGKVNDFLLYDLLIISLWVIGYSSFGGKYEKNKK